MNLQTTDYSPPAWCRGEAGSDTEACLVQPAVLRHDLEGLLFEIFYGQTDMIPLVSRFMGSFYSAYRELRRCPSVARLRQLRQFGLKADLLARQIVCSAEGDLLELSGPAFSHTRFDHSRFAAALIVALGLKLRLSERAIAVAASAALLHDIGHPPLAHDIDDLLVSLGRPSHEARGVNIIRCDTAIHRPLALLEIDPEDVVTVVEERGPLGTMLSLVDTLAYVALDWHLLEQTPSVDFVFINRIFSSIKAVRGRAFQVNDLQPLQELLRIRADLYRDHYYAFPWRILAEVRRHVYRLALELDLLCVEDLEQSSDDELYLLLKKGCQDKELPVWFKRLYDLAYHFPDEFVRWHWHSFADLATLNKQLLRLSDREVAGSLVIEPIDYRGKMIKIIDHEERARHLVVPHSHIPNVQKQWHLLWPS